jgi:hypothetical protein
MTTLAVVGVRRLYQERRVLGAGPRQLYGYEVRYVGSAGGFDVTEVLGEGPSQTPGRTIYVYREGARLFGLDVDEHGQPTGYSARFGPITVRHGPAPNTSRGNCEVTFRLDASVVHYRDRDCDGTFDDRWITSLSSRDPDDVQSADIWLDGGWVQAAPKPFATTQSVTRNGKRVVATFRDGRWQVPREAEKKGHY